MIIGGTVVVGVISYNKWQEYRAKKSVERAFSSEHDDVLMKPAPEAAARQEPSLEAGEAASQAVADQDPVLAEGQVEAPVPPQQKELPVDELVDCLIPVSFGSPVSGEKLLPKLQTLRYVGNKQVQFIGQRDDTIWEPVALGGVYYELRAAVQLANRTSPLNEIEYSELISRLRQICDEIDAEPEVPDMAAVMSGARELYQFVNEHDAQLSVNVQSNAEPWAINTLLSALERQGFDLRPDGRLVMPDGEGGVLFSLSTNVTLSAETTSRLSLLLDVPRVAPQRDGFGAMVACARVLAVRLNGTVVDDGSQPLSDAALDDIAGQVNAFYGHMEEAAVPAGSSRAMRLFS
jgi:FtsZ-interacting cell division protein ZipA